MNSRNKTKVRKGPLPRERCQTSMILAPLLRNKVLRIAQERDVSQAAVIEAAIWQLAYAKLGHIRVKELTEE
jgi:hypothetical protein